MLNPGCFSWIWRAGEYRQDTEMTSSEICRSERADMNVRVHGILNVSRYEVRREEKIELVIGREGLSRSLVEGSHSSNKYGQ